MSTLEFDDTHPPAGTLVDDEGTTRPTWCGTCEQPTPCVFRQMAVTLTVVEWVDLDTGEYGGTGQCPACCGYVKPEYYLVTTFGHKPGCALDAALTAAGLTAEDRQRVREGKGAG